MKLGHHSRYQNCCLEEKIYSLSIIEDQLANQQGNFIFSLIDLEVGFHQMHLEEEFKHLTAFNTPFGVFEWNILRMGVKVGPAAFQEIVQHVTLKCLASRPYIDDILSSSGRSQLPTQQQDIPLPVKMEDPVIRGGYIKKHYQDLVALLQAPEEAKLTVKPSKCHLFKRVVQYVGHVLKGGKRYRSPAETEALDNWGHTTINTA